MSTQRRLPRHPELSECIFPASFLLPGPLNSMPAKGAVKQCPAQTNTFIRPPVWEDAYAFHFCLCGCSSARDCRDVCQEASPRRVAADGTSISLTPISPDLLIVSLYRNIPLFLGLDFFFQGYFRISLENLSPYPIFSRHISNSGIFILARPSIIISKTETVLIGSFACFKTNMTRTVQARQ